MALTTNEEKIIKYIGQNYLMKKAMANIIPCQTLAGQEEYSATWLSKDGETALIPIQGAFYFVTDIGKMFQWNRTERIYEQANLPDTMTKAEVTAMWGLNQE